MQVVSGSVTSLASSLECIGQAPDVELRRVALAANLDGGSQDEPIEEVLLLLFRQFGFHRITAAGRQANANCGTRG